MTNGQRWSVRCRPRALTRRVVRRRPQAESDGAEAARRRDLAVSEVANAPQTRRQRNRVWRLVRRSFTRLGGLGEGGSRLCETCVTNPKSEADHSSGRRLENRTAAGARGKLVFSGNSALRKPSGRRYTGIAEI
jgi:hypothetical protein